MFITNCNTTLWTAQPAGQCFNTADWMTGKACTASATCKNGALGDRGIGGRGGLGVQTP